MKRSEIKTRTPLKRGKGLKRATKPMARKTRLKANRVPRAFRQRRDDTDGRYAAWIRTKRCLLSWSFDRDAAAKGLKVWHKCMDPMQACHVKSRGSGGTDLGNLWPGCYSAHLQQHTLGIRSFERKYEVNLRAAAADLYREYQRETGAP